MIIILAVFVTTYDSFCLKPAATCKQKADQQHTQ